MKNMPGVLLEGHLRKKDDGTYIVEQPDETEIVLTDILDQLIGADIRCTLVELEELDKIAEMIKNQQ